MQENTVSKVLSTAAVTAVLSVITIGLFWLVWNAFYGAVPAINELVWSAGNDEQSATIWQIPDRLASRWLDVLVLPFLAAVIGGSIRLCYEDERGPIIYGLSFGLASGLILVGLAAWLAGGLNDALAGGLLCGITAAGLGNCFARVPKFMNCFVITVTYSAAFGATSGFFYGWITGLALALVLFAIVATVVLLTEGTVILVRQLVNALSSKEPASA